MEMVKIEQVIVGSDERSIPAEIKSETEIAPVQSYQFESLQCFQCFITFCNSKSKERHMRNCHGDQYKQQLQQRNAVFTCYKCDKCFSSSGALSQHQASHREEKSFCCCYCRKNFSTFTELNKHRRQECIERRCPCKDCGALFPSPSRLRKHRIAVHPECPVVVSDVNTYQCFKCHRGFQTVEELLKHQKKFACNRNCDIKLQGKKRGSKPNGDAYLGLADSKKSKQEEGAEEHKGGSDTSTKKCPLNEPQVERKIPCPEADCDLSFASVAALRAHKRENHRPQ